MGCLLKQGGGLYPRLRLGAVLLAAGEGRRMGGVSKPLIRLQGVTLIRRALIGLSGAGVDEVVVVTGYAREAVEAQVQDFPVVLAHNADWADGQAGSVRVGLGALRGSFDAVFVALADQPLLAAADYTEIISAFKRHRQAGPEASFQVLVPRVDGRRGNPVLLGGEAVPRILAGEAHVGCRQFSERHPELVVPMPTANARFVVDLDTLEDVQALARRTGWRLELPETA